MPWKPPSVGKGRSPYDERWKRIRAQTLQAEPLCRLCLAAGRTVAATIVDHIVPLADGGTHATANLQPLCKRCHDAVKTPADAAARARAETVGLQVIAVDFGAVVTGVGVLDQRAIRRALAAGVAWGTAHTLSLAACDGIVQAAQRGDLPRLTGLLVTDDARWAQRAAVLLGVDPTIRPLTDPPTGDTGSEAAWFRERYGIERDARSDQPSGPQEPDTVRP